MMCFSPTDCNCIGNHFLHPSKTELEWEFVCATNTYVRVLCTTYVRCYHVCTCIAISQLAIRLLFFVVRIRFSTKILFRICCCRRFEKKCFEVLKTGGGLKRRTARIMHVGGHRVTTWLENWSLRYTALIRDELHLKVVIIVFRKANVRVETMVWKCALGP